MVVFISADYAAGEWPRLERRAAFSRAAAVSGVSCCPPDSTTAPCPGCCQMLPTSTCAVTRRSSSLTWSSPSSPTSQSSRHQRRAGSAQARPGRCGCGQADPRGLGVHAAISVPGVPDEVLPEYVPRGCRSVRPGQGDGSGATGRVRAAGRRVLVGKTRCAAEAVKELLPDWRLVHPAGPGEVAALAAAPPARTVLWLDDLQRYLDGEHGLTGGMMRALLNDPGPLVIIGTLRLDRYAAYTAEPASVGADPRARERQVLDLATVIRISPEFSLAEQDRVRAAAARDRRLAMALAAEGYGLTQTLAAAPQLVAQWEDAQATDPYAWAVMTAALDVARLGARAPLSADLLRAAAPGYCTSRQQAEAPENWFEQGLAHATRKLTGAVAALSPANSRLGTARRIHGRGLPDPACQSGPPR